MKRVTAILALGALTLLTVRPSAAKFAYSALPVPVERLLANVGKFVEKNPKDAQGYYTLGRIHSLAFVRGVAQIPVNNRTNGGDGLPGFAPYESILEPRGKDGAPKAEELGHLSESLRNYQKATELDARKSLYWLGLGWMLEQGALYAGQVALPFAGGQAVRKPAAWKERALAAYRKAYALDVESDLKEGRLGPGADTVISLEAGEGILRLLQGQRLTPAEMTEVAQVKKTVEHFKQMPRAVTPLIFPLERAASLESLLAGGATVTFDLAADTRGERWPWVNASAGILVWDPERTGRITSGAQLFGTATWSMYWSDGYAPLGALDDNRDGWLAGKELVGLAVWNDRNGNAISDPGEVKPLRDYAIARLAVRASGRTGVSPYHPHGIERGDGTTLPTYDWVPTSVPRLLPTR
jgi:hypothetical protein